MTRYYHWARQLATLRRAPFEEVFIRCKFFFKLVAGHWNASVRAGRFDSKAQVPWNLSPHQGEKLPLGAPIPGGPSFPDGRNDIQVWVQATSVGVADSTDHSVGDRVHTDFSGVFEGAVAGIFLLQSKVPVTRAIQNQGM